MENDKPRGDKPEDQPDESAEGRSGESADVPPALPSDDDDSALGDTDQHSDAQA